MIRRRPVFTDHDIELWEAFLAAYLASEKRQMVNVFLRGLTGGPRG